MNKNRILSFKYAGAGILTALQDEPNLKIHFFIAVLTIFAGFYFGISTIEWLILFLSIGGVISLELTNTAIEEVVNTFTQEHHPSAKKAKDVAAGAVLIASIFALMIGVVIFLPYINNSFLK